MTMYLEHFGLREAPFRITPHTEFFFSGANRGTTLEALLYAITAGEGMVKVTGEVGSGKTMLCRVLMERLPETVETIYLAVPSLSRDEMLAAIATDLGIDVAGANTTKLIRALQERLIEIHTSGRSVVALIDEAHAMPLATLEEIRLLSNLETGKEKLLQIVLFGQPELDAHLALPNMRQLKERITHSFGLGPLPAREVGEYVNFRLRAAGYHGPALFGPDALRIIAEASEGLTRRINIYADKTLLAAFAAGTHTVSADHARAAVTDTQIVVNRRASPRRTAAIAASALVAGVAGGFGIAQLTGPVGIQAPASISASAPPAAARLGTPAAMPVSATATMPSPPGASAAAEPPGSPASVQAPAREPVVAPAAPPSPANGAGPAVPQRRDLFSSRLAAGRDALAESSGMRYAVQLMVSDARDRAYVEAYLSEAARNVEPAQLYVVPSGSQEAPRLGVLFGSFDRRAEAMAAIDSLPASLKQFRPYVRGVDALREEARRAEGR